MGGRVMADFGTFDLSNVLQSVDAIRTARLQQQVYGNELAEYDRRLKEQQELKAARTAAWGGSQEGIAQLAGIDPQAAVSMQQYYDGLSKEKRAEELADAQKQVERLGKSAAWIKGAANDQEAAYRWGIIRKSDPQLAKQMPEQYDPQMVDLALAQSQSVSEILAGIDKEKGQKAFSAGISALGGGSYFDQMAQKESGGDYNAQNPKSSASGKYQFIDSTWRQVMGDAPRTPENQEIAMRKLTDQNARALSRAGFNPSPEVLALAHQQGVGGAIQLLSNPNARAVDIVGAAAVTQNGGNENMTAGEFAQRVMGYYAGGDGAPSQPQQSSGPQIDPRYLALMQLTGDPALSDPQREALKAIAESFKPQEAPGVGDRYRNVDGVGLVDLAAQGGPQAVPLPAAQSFRQATPEEAATYGAVAGQFGPDGKFYPMNPPSGMTVESDGEGGFRMTQGPGVANSSKPLNESQSKNVIYATRAEGALSQLDQVADALTSRTDQAAGAVPLGLGRGYQDPKYQVAQQAADEFLTAILRKDTGAAITREEQQIYGDTYLPRPGDSPELLQQKAQSRARAVEALRRGMTPAEILALEKGSPSEPATMQQGAAKTYRYNPDTDQLEPM